MEKGHKKTCWCRCVDDMFIIWPCGMKELQEVVQHVNSIHVNISLLWVEKRKGLMKFLYILVTRKPCGDQGHTDSKPPVWTPVFMQSHHYSLPWYGVFLHFLCLLSLSVTLKVSSVNSDTWGKTFNGIVTAVQIYTEMCVRGISRQCRRDQLRWLQYHSNIQCNVGSPDG